MDNLHPNRRQWMATARSRHQPGRFARWAKSAIRTSRSVSSCPLTPAATDIVARVWPKHEQALGSPSWWKTRRVGRHAGHDQVAKSAPDGSTLVIAQHVHADQPVPLHQDGLQPAKGLVAAVGVASAPVTLVVHPSVPANTMPELLAWVKANKGKVSYGSWGVGSSPPGRRVHEQDHERRHVPCGLPGRGAHDPGADWWPVQLCFSSAQNTKPFIDNGRLKAIGVRAKRACRCCPMCPRFMSKA